MTTDVSVATAAPVRARRARADAPPDAPALVASETAALAAPPPIIQQTPPGAEPPVLDRPANFVRQPFSGVRYKLDNTPRPGFFRRWFNDDRNRIMDAQKAGYSFVHDQNGQKVKYVAGTREGGGGMTAYYMEIPQEWYDADQVAKREMREAKMNQIRLGNVGDVTVGQDGAYRPMNKSGTLGADIRIPRVK